MYLVLSLPALVLGILVGIVSGLTPGIHVNLIASLMVAFYASASLDKEFALPISIFIVAVSITHAFFDYIPSLFLGIPTDEVYSLLPGQRLIKEGNGGEALNLSIEGSWRGLKAALLIASLCTLLTVIGINPIEWVEKLIKPGLFWILLIASAILIITEKNRLTAGLLFLLSGIFGIIILGTPLIPGGSSAAFGVLFPALSGLFGISGLLQTLSEKTASLPPQNKNIKLNLPESEINKGSLIGTLSGMAVGLLPGLGSANAATLALLFIGNQETSDRSRLYIVITSAIQSSDALFGIAALYFINKSRSGASVAINSIIGDLDSWITMILILMGMGIAGFLSRKLLLKTWRPLTSVIDNLDYKSLTIAIIVFITTLVLMSTGIWGLLILVAGSCLGLLPSIFQVRKSQMMGLFLVPVLLFFSGYQDTVVSFFALEGQSSPPVNSSLSEISIFLLISVIIAISSYFINSKFQRNT